MLYRKKHAGRWLDFTFLKKERNQESTFEVCFAFFFFQVEKRGQLINQLKDLKQLLADNVFTEDEYRQQKEQILREMDT